MTFFDRQDRARRNTKKLVVYFVLAVLCIIASVYLACFFVFVGTSRHHSVPFWNGDLFFYSSMGTLAVIICGSLYQISALSGGGSVVAESLGGRLLNSNSTDFQERKLLNIVEEMSIASGTPMPKVYVMDEESGINAFAAGHSTDDAVVAVTRGCLQSLNRDELQGVIGHEFSHILNGDMRLNLRLMGIIFGILCLATIGRIMLRTSSSGRRNPLPVLGFLLMAIGGLGVFFGRLIQSAVSRQREFLADASAVQFTRNPSGLSSALQKIGAVGSQMQSERAADACHMFFGNGLGESFLGWFSTHPPIEERIRAIDPTWNGEFPTSRDARFTTEQAEANPQYAGIVSNLAGANAVNSPSPNAVRAQAVMTQVGQPTPLHLRYAEEMREAFPDPLRDAVHDSTGAIALIYGLLLSPDESTRATQLDGLAKQTSPALRQQIESLLVDLVPIATRARLPFVNIALPALRQMSSSDYVQFTRTLKWLIESDRQIDLFEFVLKKILERNLGAHFSPRAPAAAQYYTLKPLLPDAAVLLSALAQTSSTNADAIAKAFRAGAPHLRAQQGELTLLSRNQSGLQQIDSALNRLALAVPQIKRNILEASVQVIGADGVIEEREAELLRAIAETLDCPIPPFIEVHEASPA